LDKGTKGMKVLILTTFYFPHWTGLVQYAKSLAEGLVIKNNNVTILTTRHENRLKDRENIAGVDVFRTPVWFRVSRTWISPKFVFEFKKITENDVVIVFLPMAEAVIAVLLARIFKKKVYLVHNGDLVLTAGLLNRVIEKIFIWTTAIAISLSNGIIVNTKDYAENSQLLKRFESKWIEIRPPFKKMVIGENGETKIDEKLTGSKYVVGFAGRFVEEKGFDLLLDAIPLVKNKLPGVRFLFAGETNMPYEKTFEKHELLINKLKDDLIMMSRLERDEMANFYKALDVFVISSKSDFFPFTQAEALISGVPVVVMDIPGARWPVVKTGMGILVRFRNPIELADGIVKAIKNRNLLMKNFNKVKDFFNYESTMQKYENLLKGKNESKLQD